MAVPSDPTIAARSGDNPWRLRIAITCVMAGAFMQSLDLTIANVALPHMQGGLQAGRDEVSWVLTSYMIAAALGTLPTGWLASRFGRKPVFVTSLAGFIFASVLCGAAQSLEEMVAFRFVQGLFGAALTPISQSIVFDRFPAELRGKVLALWTTVVMLGPVTGPTLGGWLTDHYSWRWVFFINLPVGLVATTGVVLLLKRNRRPHTERFDGTGFALFGIAIVALQLVLDRGSSIDWFESPEILLEAGVSALAAYLFIVHTATTKVRLFPPAMFRDRCFASGAFLSPVVAGMLISTTALIPPYLQTLGGYSVLSSGLILATRGVGSVLCLQIISRVVSRADPRYLLVIGSAVTIWTLWSMSRWTPDVDQFTVSMMALIQGFAMGFVYIPVTYLAFTTLPQDYRTHAASVLNLLRSFGAALSITATTVVITSSSQVMHAQIAENVTPFNRTLMDGAAGVYWNPMLPAGAEVLESVIHRSALAVAYSNAFVLMALVSLVVPIVAMLTPKPPLGAGAATEIID